MNYAGFIALIEEIKSLGYDERTAAHFAVLIGDIPITDPHGNIVVMDGDKVLATLKLKFFEE